MKKIAVLLVFFLAYMAGSAWAIPVFSRQYGVSCQMCHAAFPRLNSVGERFLNDYMRLSNWRDVVAFDVGDENLALPKLPPFSVRAQGKVQYTEGYEVDPVTGPTKNETDFDLQSPYLLKLASSAPLSDNITYYFYIIYADKGNNGVVLLEDAWISHNDLFSTGIALQFGQFQICDLMFSRERRMTFQDFMPYRMAGLTYDRGFILGREIGALDLRVGATNGNGVRESFDINGPGYNRSDKMFDNDTDKSVFGRIGVDAGLTKVGVFGLAGKQKSATGPAGTESGENNTDKQILGLDLSGNINGNIYWFAQGLWNKWDDFLVSGESYNWFGSFAGIDYVYSNKWTCSMLYNYADADDFKDTGTIYEGINMNSLTIAASHYFMTNVKGSIEANYDFLKKDHDADFVGHETREGYVLAGFDLAF